VAPAQRLCDRSAPAGLDEPILGSVDHDARG
jgi:hypothetical protein